MTYTSETLADIARKQRAARAARTRRAAIAAMRPR